MSLSLTDVRIPFFDVSLFIFFSRAEPLIPFLFSFGGLALTRLSHKKRSVEPNSRRVLGYTIIPSRSF